MSMTTSLVLASALAFTSSVAFSQTPVSLASSSGHDGEIGMSRPWISPESEVAASFTARLTQADPSHRGEAWFIVTADLDGPKPEHVIIRVPISSTEDAYGESRSCSISKDGSRQLTFTAGLDEDNYVSFAPNETVHDFRFLLNKYLCRVLAAPFHCGGEQVALPKDLTHWHLAGQSSLLLSTDAPASLAASTVHVVKGAIPFDYARCAIIAPSNGMCCVGGRTTEWHCGGTPVGEGWHQVSGECFHRETGGTCHY